MNLEPLHFLWVSNVIVRLLILLQYNHFTHEIHASHRFAGTSARNLAGVAPVPYSTEHIGVLSNRSGVKRTKHRLIANEPQAYDVVVEFSYG